MASVYANENQDKVNGLILLASYPIVDVKNSSTLLIYGSNDNILNKNQYDENKKFLPNNYTEYIIQGGNHAQYAYYGIQSGDGKANITTNNQIKETVDEIISFMRVR